MKKIAMFVLALVVSLNIMPISSEAKETQANKLAGFMYEYAINVEYNSFDFSQVRKL